MDKETTIEELKQSIKKFCDARDWNQFHNPKDLAIGMSTEANELLDIFRFKSDEQMKEIMKIENREHVCEELSDTLYFVLRFAQMNDIDLSTELLKKLEKNNKHYPVEKAKGSNKKYKEL